MSYPGQVNSKKKEQKKEIQKYPPHRKKKKRTKDKKQNKTKNRERNLDLKFGTLGSSDQNPLHNGKNVNLYLFLINNFILLKKMILFFHFLFYFIILFFPLQHKLDKRFNNELVHKQFNS